MQKAFRLIGFLEGTSYLLLLFLAVPIKYLGENELFWSVLTASIILFGTFYTDRKCLAY